MIKLFLPFFAAFSLFLGACAQAPRLQPVMAPSTVGIKQSATAIETRIDAAQTHASKAKTAIQDARQAKDSSSLMLALGQANDEIDDLTAELIGAKSESTMLRGKVEQLDTQIQDVTRTANTAISQAQKLHEENAILQKSRDYWRGLALKIIGALVAIGILGAIWLFRKPLMMLCGIPPI